MPDHYSVMVCPRCRVEPIQTADGFTCPKCGASDSEDLAGRSCRRTMTQMLPLDSYSNGKWTYPEGWGPREILENALLWALKDLEESGPINGVHPRTTTPRAIGDALEALREGRGDDS